VFNFRETTTRGGEIVMTLASADLERLRVAAQEKSMAVVELAERICAIAAPTGNERQRAELVEMLLRERGYRPEIDEISNVYVRRPGREQESGQRPVLMLLAHMDTVFPLDTPIIIKHEHDIVRGPGIGDNSVGVAAMITLLEILDALQIETASDIIVVADVGEEGLGDLCGARQAVERYRESLGAVIVIDGHLGAIVNSAVGSLRWKITVRGAGGHAFGSFGTPSAIHGLGKIIAAVADLEVPHEPRLRTTFNVGMIEGGTSINTIAATASALIDMRSVDINVLYCLAERVRFIVDHEAGPGLQTEIELLGQRPAGQCEPHDPLVVLSQQVLQWVGVSPRCVASSTDANIPISMNIPSVCIGITNCEKAHTLDECIHIKPIQKGLAQLLRLVIEASALIVR
jgi:tripeptide aminopeptidase